MKIVDAHSFVRFERVTTHSRSANISIICMLNPNFVAFRDISVYTDVDVSVRMAKMIAH